MKMKGILIATCALVVIAFDGCKKYEDGPFMSIHTKTHRLAATWIVKSESEDGVDKTSDFASLYQGYVIAITADNTYAMSYAYNGIFNYSETGTWDWDKKKEHVFLTRTSSNSQTDWEILKLKEKEMKVRYTDYSSTPNKTIEITFTALN